VTRTLRKLLRYRRWRRWLRTAKVLPHNTQLQTTYYNCGPTVTDTAGETHSYEGGHYLAVVGYGSGGNTVTIADSADTAGSPDYNLTVTQLGNWIATRGYAS
jgi:hypothetical protein